MKASGAFPDWVEPMAATLTQERFTGPEWIFERKLDGIRLLAFKHGRDVRLFSRNRLPQNAAYPAVVEAIAQLPARDLILDGEATGVWGKQGKAAYNVFDILGLDGRDPAILNSEITNVVDPIFGIDDASPLQQQVIVGLAQPAAHQAEKNQQS